MPELAAKIVHAYTVLKMRPSAIHKETGISLYAIESVLSHAQVDRGQVLQGRPRLLSQEQEARIVTFYLAGNSCETTARELGTSAETVRRTLERHNVDRRPLSDARRQFFVRSDAFDELTEDAAYWLGFLMADGCVVDTTLAVGLHKQDEAHLHKLNHFLGSDSRSITAYGEHRLITFHSQALVDSLARWGVVPRKTFTAQALGGVDQLAPFWRGLIDGDGHITRRNGETALSTASPRLRAQYLAYLDSLGYQARCRAVGSTTQIACPISDSLALLKTLYEHASTYLDRKYALASSWIERHKQKPVKPRLGARRVSRPAAEWITFFAEEEPTDST